MRLRVKQDFQSVLGHSRQIKSKHLILFYKSNHQLHSRLGIIVSKRYLNTAVARNQLKRITRESFRHRQSTLKGLDLVIRVRREWSPLEKTALWAELEQLWQALENASSA